MPEKPLLWSDRRSALERFDPLAMEGLPPGYIPGYTEQLKANSIDKADDLIFRESHQDNPHISTKEDAFKQIGAHPQPLDVEFKWLPISGYAGGEMSAGQRAQIEKFRRQGFSPVRVSTTNRESSEADFKEQFGYGFPPEAHVEADGTIRRGADAALYVRSGEVARKWDAYGAKLTAEREGAHIDDTLRAGGEQTDTFIEEERETRDITT